MESLSKKNLYSPVDEKSLKDSKKVLVTGIVSFTNQIFDQVLGRNNKVNLKNKKNCFNPVKAGCAKSMKSRGRIVDNKIRLLTFIDWVPWRFDKYVKKRSENVKKIILTNIKMWHKFLHSFSRAFQKYGFYSFYSKNFTGFLDFI